MKKTILSILALLIALSLTACSGENSDEPQGMQRISNEYVDYNLFVPDKWTPETSTGVITAKYSDSVLVNVSMTALRLPDDIGTPEEYWESFKEDFGTVFDEWELLSDEATTLDGHAAHRYVYAGYPLGLDVKVQYAQTVCIRSGALYLFTYTAEEQQYEKYLPDVEQMLEHFSFKN